MLTTASISKGTILRITCVLWIVAKLICYKLWLSDRLFPLVPVADVLLAVPAWLHMALYVASLLLMAAIVLRPSVKWLQVLLLTSEVASCLLDQNRWQPWEYQYLFTLLIVLVNKDTLAALKMFGFMLAATYVYSGLNKFTSGFLSEIWDALILRGFFKLPSAFIHQPIVYYMGYLAGVVELLCGIGLLFGPARKLCAGVLVGMHLFILLLLGPLGLNINMVVWPWNVGMIVYLLVLMWRSDIAVWDKRVLLRRYNNIVWVAWGVLPVLCFWGLWDNYLSSNLYSGRQPYMMICISNPDAIPTLQPYLQTDRRNICNGASMISVNKWTYKELNVPPYPEYRVMYKIEAAFRQRYPQAGASFVLYRQSK